MSAALKSPFPQTAMTSGASNKQISDHDHESEGSVSLRSRKRLTLNGLPVQRGLYRFEKLEPIQYLACIRGHRRRKILVVNIE